jgi:hypothetical protein
MDKKDDGKVLLPAKKETQVEQDFLYSKRTGTNRATIPNTTPLCYSRLRTEL